MDMYGGMMGGRAVRAREIRVVQFEEAQGQMVGGFDRRGMRQLEDQAIEEDLAHVDRLSKLRDQAIKEHLEYRRQRNRLEDEADALEYRPMGMAGARRGTMIEVHEFAGAGYAMGHRMGGSSCQQLDELPCSQAGNYASGMKPSMLIDGEDMQEFLGRFKEPEDQYNVMPKQPQGFTTDFEVEEVADELEQARLTSPRPPGPEKNKAVQWSGDKSSGTAHRPNDVAELRRKQAAKIADAERNSGPMVRKARPANTTTGAVARQRGSANKGSSTAC